MGGRAGGPPEPDDFMAELARWSATDRLARAVSERSRVRSLRDQSSSSATWSGILVDLAETSAEVSLALSGPVRVSGRLIGTGRDFVVVEDRRPVPVLVRSAAITALTPGPGSGASDQPAGRRRPPLDMSLADALDALAAERTPALVRTGGEPVAGILTACGRDVLTIRADGTGRPVYVPLGAVACVEMR